MKRILCALLLPGILAAGSLHAREQRLTVGNNDFSATLQACDGRIRAVSLLDRNSGNELLAPVGAPLFEFAVNGRTVDSEMPLWDHVSTTEQKLSNQGTIVTYTFAGRKELRGLRVMIDREYFPSGIFLRERLRLRADRPGKFRLTNMDGRNRFVFPRYTLTEADGGAPTEIRIGSYGREVLPDYDAARSDDRRPNRNLATCHMFHPDIRKHNLSDGDSCEVKGPFLLVPTRRHRILTSYEHASQDHCETMLRPQPVSTLTDASQGVKGAMDPMSDDDLWFIATAVAQHDDCRTLEWHIRRGGYLDGEAIPHDTDYETVWSTVTVLEANETTADAIRKYLLHRITENTRSREPQFYYNTWGMQRDSTPNMRELFTESRISREITLAAETGVDLFIFDDGWQQAMGDWRPHAERLPRGLTPLVDSLRRHGITPGIWLSLLGIDPALDRAKEHPEWIIRDRNGVPYAAQWDYPACDLISEFYDCLCSTI